jgi:dienelactone hydrolase
MTKWLALAVRRCTDASASLVLGLCAGLAGAVHAQAPELNASLNESVLMIPWGSPSGHVELETTMYKPSGGGPFPLVVINHGTATGNPRLQERNRPVVAARYFVERGYVVLAPMRGGFSKSGGDYRGSRCDSEGDGRIQAESVSAVLDYARAQAYVDKNRILLVGQSTGGWTVLALGAQNYPGVKGLLNFAGGTRQAECEGWQAGLARAAGAYGATTKVPSLWFYGDNDSYFPSWVWRDMIGRYNGAGGKAQLIAFGAFGSDAHDLFAAGKGAPIWQPEVSRFLRSVGLPSQLVIATGLAAITDESKLPFLSASGKAGYKVFLSEGVPRAYAVGPEGNWGWASGGDDPAQDALDRCNRHPPKKCKLYAADNDVVWTTP